MPRAAPILSSFNAGELSPNVDGRVDVAKYGSGCKILENFIPMIQGPAKRRGGTKFVAEIKDSTKRAWLVRFEFNVQQAYVLEFGDQYIRFYTNHGQLVSGGVPYEIASPWTAADLTSSDGTFGLRFVESNDIIYICHPSYAPRKLMRYGPTNWVIDTLVPTNGPFKKINTTATTVYASAQTGTGITLTASSGIFQAGHVGSLFYLGQRTVLNVQQWEAGKSVTAGDRRRSGGLNYIALNSATTGGSKPVHTEGAVYDGGVQWQYEDSGWGYVKITGFTSSTVVTADVIKPIPFYAVTASSATTKWAYGDWSAVEGWPSQVSFYKERLTFGRNQNVWMSVSGDYENFAAKDETNTVTAQQAISITLQSDRANALQWFASADSLICGTAGSEFAVQPITTNQPFGPENCTAPTVSVFGSKAIVPVRIGDAIVFCQRAGLKFRDVIYDYLSNKFQSTDQNVFADHIAKAGFKDMVYQQEPYSIIWAVRSDGQLVAMTYSREQYESPPFGGWHRHPLGGDAVVESMAVIPSPDGDREELWLIVRRTINGVSKRYVEYMAAEFDENTGVQADAYYVDCGATYSGAPATVISGLTWLEGQTVSILADGAVQPNRTVVSGAITLDVAASKVQVGLPCPARLQSMRLNAGAGDGTSQGKTARINKLTIRFRQSLGLMYGRSFDAMDEIDFRTVADGMNAPPALFTGDKVLDFNGDYSTDPWLCLKQSDPLPSTIVGIMPIVSTYDRG